ncbi:MAG: hypothetical protein ABIH85_08840 [Candidatus Omnitrophota bacterium]
MRFNFYNKLYVKISENSDHAGDFLKTKYKNYGCKLEDNGLNEEDIITLDFVPKFEEKTLSFLKREAAFDNNSFYILDKKGNKMKCDFNGPLWGNKFVIENNYDCSFLDAILRSVIFMKLCFKNFIPVHASSVEYNKDGILMPAWAATGKTRMLLSLIEKGGEFVSDEWTFIGEDKLFTYSNVFLVCDYDIKEFPEVCNLSLWDKIRLDVNSLCKPVIAKRIMERLGLSMRSKKYDLYKMFPEAKTSTAFSEVYFLQKYNGKQVKKSVIPLDDLANKLYHSFSMENSVFFHYYSLFKFAFFEKEKDLKRQFEEKYKSSLTRALAEKECFELLVPESLKYKDFDIRGVISG